jgi:hypothetical protein
VSCAVVPFGVEELRGWMRERARSLRVPEFHQNLKGRDCRLDLVIYRLGSVVCCSQS